MPPADAVMSLEALSAIVGQPTAIRLPAAQYLNLLGTRTYTIFLPPDSADGEAYAPGGEPRSWSSGKANGVAAHIVRNAFFSPSSIVG